MSGLELLQKHPLTANVIKEWFMKSMLESFKDESVPSEFKQFMLEQGIEDDKVGTLIDVNPRTLFDVFDENKIYIVMGIIDGKDFKPSFWFHVHGINDNSETFNTRKEAELFAIEAAFEILENKLSPKLEE